ncbi:methyltransferase domain-containing protein [Streptomyces sp. XM83C]|jgi:SAM-dependent methyltransferase|uniref:Class I SAM-dependent methyltransferase n=1 Tax=Streptomyces thermocoprophilus TaxID=78356 RepID=A0ABV5V932_9ACTN|nr:methyltransferase domain-containing protein [Streptomyces sp. XM83C]MCK1819457.1 methyltransferase domain-containing protein [Streptomyces sp. XM83C]
MTRTLQAAPANAEQVKAWDGEEGAYWAEHADRYDRALRGYLTPFFEAAAVGPADRVLDVGCGTGEISREAGRRAPRGSVLGVDLSTAMLRVARQRAEEAGLGHVRFEQADAQIHLFPEGGFDLVVSRTGTMFFGDLDAAFRNLARATRPDGRLVQLVWQPAVRNEWFLTLTTALAAGRDLPGPPPGAPGPFALSEPDRVRALLTGAGFTGLGFEPFAAPMHFGTDADDAHRFVVGQLGWMLEGLDDTGRARALDDLHAALRARETPEGVLLPSATWLITATRR